MMLDWSTMDTPSVYFSSLMRAIVWMSDLIPFY